MGKKSGSGINIPDYFSESQETNFRFKKYSNSLMDPGSAIFLTVEPG
jgi:hypothetical protein